METKFDDLLIFDDDLIGVNDIVCLNNESKLKTYYELENELEQVKNALTILQKQMETILQTQKPIEINYIYSLNNKLEIINTNCNTILFEYYTPDIGFTIDIDNVKLNKYDFNNLNKLFKTFIHINEINVDIRFPISSNSQHQTQKQIYFVEHFNVIKELVKINNNIKINIKLSALAFPFEWLEMLFEDINIKNINIINISYWNREDIHHTRLIKNTIKNIDNQITDKIHLQSTELT